jgi:tetratricopeptide (TPR) repeat protein
MSLLPTRLAEGVRGVLLTCSTAAFAAALAGCASTSSLHVAQEAENAQEYDRAVVEYTKAVRANPNDKFARAALDRVKLRAAQDHTARGRRLAALDRYEEAVVELQLASELNPTDSQVDAELKDARQRLRAQVTVTRGGQTQLQTLVAKVRDLPPAGQELPSDVKLPGSLQFGNGATSRAVFLTVGRFANMSVIFDSAFHDQPLSIDLRNMTLSDALAALTASTHTFYRVTATRTVTIVPDTPAPRVRRGRRSDVLPEQRGHQGDDRSASDRRRYPSDFADYRHERDIDQGHARAACRRVETDRRDRQGAAGMRHRRRTPRSGSQQAQGIRHPDRVTGPARNLGVRRRQPSELHARKSPESERGRRRADRRSRHLLPLAEKRHGHADARQPAHPH